MIKNIFGLGFATEVGIEDENKSFYLNDNIGSPRLKIGNNGRVEDRYNFSPFGIGSSDVNTGFTGYQTDKGSNLLFAQARYYMPKLGRFISEDPHNGTISYPFSLNKYMYCYNNPLKFIDPTGYVAGDFVMGAWEWIKEHKDLILEIIIYVAVAVVVALAVVVAVATFGWAIVAIAALAGFLIAGGINFGYQVATKGINNVNWSDVIISGLGGAACGVMALTP